MIELWHCVGARSFRPLWMLEEMGLSYRLHLLPFPPRWRAPEYLAVNPLGTIPCMRDGDLQMTESVAMLAWLGARHGPTDLVVGEAEAGWGGYLNWLFQADATFTFPLTIVLRYRLLEPEERRQPKVAEDYAKWFLSRFRHVERALEDGRDWLVAGRFTAADMAVGYAAMLAGQLGLLGEVGPRTRDWWARCEARDGYQRARQAEGNGQAF